MNQMTLPAAEHALKPAVGHNNPPPDAPENDAPYNNEEFDALDRNAREIADAAGQWKEIGRIESREQAQKANDFLAGARGLAQQIEARRKEAKQPYLDAGREIDGAFGALKEIVELAVNLVKPLLSQYLQEQEDIAAARKAEEERKAREAAATAEMQRRAAEARNDVVGVQAAQRQKQQAENAIKAAADKAEVKLGSATGGGRTISLRSRRHAQIGDLNQAMLHYRSHPDMAELLVRLANADIRAAKGKTITIPGIDIVEERKL